jgi:hypothetical protein
MILKKQADFYFDSGRYSDAALCFAKTSALSFEEITLKFLAIKNDLALRTYLLAKLKTYKHADIIQSTLLCFWVLELYLVDLGDRSDILEAEFRQFLSAFHNRMDADAVYKLIDAHGNVDDKLFFAELSGDRETIISHWIKLSDFTKASLALMASVSYPLLIDRDR